MFGRDCEGRRAIGAQHSAHGGEQACPFWHTGSPKRRGGFLFFRDCKGNSAAYPCKMLGVVHVVLLYNNPLLCVVWAAQLGRAGRFLPQTEVPLLRCLVVGAWQRARLVHQPATVHAAVSLCSFADTPCLRLFALGLLCCACLMLPACLPRWVALAD